MTKSVRISDEAYKELKKISDEQDTSMADVVDGVLGSELQQASKKQDIRGEVARYMKHLASGECNSEVCEELREEYNLKQDVEEGVESDNIVGKCPDCGETFTKEDVIEPMLGGAVVKHIECEGQEGKGIGRRMHLEVSELEEV